MSPLNTHSSTSAAKRARALFSLVALTVWLMLEALTAPAALAADPGDLDESFGGDGRVTLDIFLGSREFGSAAAIQSDGKIVVAGTYKGFDSATRTWVFALARFNPNGSVDTSFGSDGRTLTVFPNTFWRADAQAVAIQRDGKIVVAGSARSVANGRDDFALARYNPNGTLDTSFSGDGMLTTDFGISGGANAVAVQRDGKIVVGGYVITREEESFYNSKFALARYNPNGTPDDSFDDDGKVATGVDNLLEEVSVASAVAIQPDGKIVAAGSTQGYSCQWPWCLRDKDFGLVRFNTNGSLDDSFNGDGTVTTGFDDLDTASAIAIQPDGKIVAAGSSYNRDGTDFALARYNTDGRKDRTFGEEGKVKTSIADEGLSAQGVAIQSDGKIVAAGSVGPKDWPPGDQDFETIRYNTNGTLDTDFDENGLQATEFGGEDHASAVAIQPDGRIVAVGWTSAGAGIDFALARYHA